MNIQITQFSSLIKLRRGEPFPSETVTKLTALCKERVSYQVSVKSDIRTDAVISVESPLKDYIKIYQVKDVLMDQPTTQPDMEGEDYLTLEPGLMPDLLCPTAESQNCFLLSSDFTTFRIRVDLPKDIAPGEKNISVIVTPKSQRDATGQPDRVHADMTISVLPCVMPDQKLIYTRWFYVDCIATQHNVKIYSEEHWTLIDRYLAAASDMGINMILVPTHTPPLDTAVGTVRPCVQLIDIEKTGNSYRFDFTRFHRFIGLCKKNQICYFEMAHLFSQWGAKYAANILVTENGKTDYLFGWNTPADAPEYYEFLKQYLPAISAELEKEGISEQTYFHISDEPTLDHTAAYQKASELIRSLIGNCKTMDALSNYEFYKQGLVQCPVTVVSHIHEFLGHDIENLWAYYCCEPEKGYLNSFMAMPSYRIRVLGFLLYKYDIKGFLHWGFNFYNAALSLYPINPYLTTSSDRRFPSGDPFIVYPGKDTVYSSLRAEVLYDAIQDMNICFALEKNIGRDAVIQMIDEAAGCELRFDDYPHHNSFCENLRKEMLQKLKER